MNPDTPSFDLASLPELAIAAAREVTDPYAKAHALSDVAPFGGPDKEVLFQEAAGAAMQVEDPARRFTALMDVAGRLARS